MRQYREGGYESYNICLSRSLCDPLESRGKCRLLTSTDMIIDYLFYSNDNNILMYFLI